VTTKDGIEFVQRFYKQVPQPWPCSVSWSRGEGTDGNIDTSTIDATSVLASVTSGALPYRSHVSFLAPLSEFNDQRQNYGPQVAVAER